MLEQILHLKVFLNKLIYKISSTSIRYIEDIEKFRLNNYSKRIVTDSSDIIVNLRTFDTIFPFKVDDLVSIKLCSRVLKLQ